MRLLPGVLFFCLLWSTSSRAATPSALAAGVSYVSYEVDQLAHDDSGATGFLGTPFYELDLQYRFQLTKTLLFAPAVGYMPPSLYASQTPDKGAKVSFMTVGLPVIYNVGQHFDVSAGPALERYTVAGKGGQVTLNNGNSQATFLLPNRDVTTTTVALQTGVGVDAGRWRGGLDILTSGLASSTRRSLSLVLTVGGDLHVFK